MHFSLKDSYLIFIANSLPATGHVAPLLEDKPAPTVARTARTRAPHRSAATGHSSRKIQLTTHNTLRLPITRKSIISLPTPSAISIVVAKRLTSDRLLSRHEQEDLHKRPLHDVPSGQAISLLCIISTIPVLLMKI